MTRCPHCLSPVAAYRLTTYAPGCGTPERETIHRVCACPTQTEHSAYLLDLADRLHLAIHEHRGVEDGQGRLVLGDDDTMRLHEIARDLKSARVEVPRSALAQPCRVGGREET